MGSTNSATNNHQQTMKDPNAPKRPMSGYFRFVHSVRADIAKETGLKGTAASGEFSKRWKACPQEKKDELIAAYREDMKVYKAKFEEYKKTDDYKNFQKLSFNKKFKKCPKDKNAPKKPLTPFFLFSMEMRPKLLAEDPTLKIEVLGKKMGALWNALSAEEKQKYISEREKNMEVYKVALEQYKQTQEYQDYQAIKRRWQEDKKRASRARRPY